MSRKLTFNAAPDELAVFLAETDELLQSLDNAVVALERDPGNHELLQEIFRIAHTIKGSSASIGHTAMAELTHGLETLLDQLRTGVLTARPDIVDLLLQSLDMLRALADEVRMHESAGLDLRDLIGTLSACADPAAAAASPSRGATVGSETALTALPVLDDAHALRIHVELADDVQMPAVRIFQALLSLDEIGRVAWCDPGRERVDAGEVGKTLDALIATSDSVGDVEARLLAIPDVTRAAIASAEDAGESPDLPRPATGENAPTNEAPATPVGQKAPAAAAAAHTAKAVKTVRIDVEQLDALMNLVGELVIDRTRLQSITARTEALSGDDGLLGELAATALHLERITTELQAQIMKSRMLPIEHVFSRFPRVVRDLARRFGKEIDLEIAGADTELDRSVIEEIGEPLIHLLRNAIDHGVEPGEERVKAGKPRVGRVRLSARHESGQIVIDVADDGRGIDSAKVRQSALARGLITVEAAERLDAREAVNLIFLPGVSTAREVSDVSGRGVGMDVVRASLEKINGSISIGTALGQGTTFSIRLPLTLAIVRALLVAVGQCVYALPVSSVVETLRVEHEALRRVNRRFAVDVRGAVMPLVPLSALLAPRGAAAVEAIGSVPLPDRRLIAVAVQHGVRQVGLMVDAVLGEQEVVIKPLDPLIGEIDGVPGTAILGDGRVAPILYVPGLVKDLAPSGLAEATARVAA